MKKGKKRKSIYGSGERINPRTTHSTSRELIFQFGDEVSQSGWSHFSVTHGNFFKRRPMLSLAWSRCKDALSIVIFHVKYYN